MGNFIICGQFISVLHRCGLVKNEFCMLAEIETLHLGVGQLVHVRPREGVGGRAFAVEDATGLLTLRAITEDTDGVLF